MHHDFLAVEDKDHATIASEQEQINALDLLQMLVQLTAESSPALH